VRRSPPASEGLLSEPFHHHPQCLINEADALSRTYRLAAVPCPSYPGCFRWIVSSSDGLFAEESTYPYATKAAAMIVGRIRMADLSAGRHETEPRLRQQD
jgi:hypothetical protein